VSPLLHIGGWLQTFHEPAERSALRLFLS